MHKEPHVSSGRLDRITFICIKYVDARNIDIWLPDGYDSKKKYAVLYMHDGQMLFDSTTTWNKRAWDVDDVAAVLIRKKSEGFHRCGDLERRPQKACGVFSAKAI